jgi:hypothetical protein
MSHLNRAYQEGIKQAEADFGDWLASGLDNPTAPPPERYTKTAIDRMIEKLAKPKKRQSEQLARAAVKGTKFKTMVTRLKKKKQIKGR